MASTSSPVGPTEHRVLIRTITLTNQIIFSVFTVSNRLVLVLFCLSAYKAEIMKIGLLKCREEPPKLLQGNKFQERTFQIKDHKLLLLKDKKVLLGLGFGFLTDLNQSSVVFWSVVHGLLRVVFRASNQRRSGL